MKKIYFIILPLILVCLITGSASLPQTRLQKTESANSKIQKDKTQGNLSEHLKQSLTCKSCHITEYPTKKDPGLQNCPREDMASAYHPPKEGPDVVTISDMSDKYDGVVFSHRIHSQMSEMSDGCTGCHHYNTTGPVLNCRQCHEKTRSREDISVPDLKAAFHRRCMTCHKQWSGENGCSTQCHLRKGSDRQKAIETFKDKTHPALVEPTKMIWETNSDKGKIVTFYHDEHIKLFRINCKSCHSQENCIKCHEQKVRGDSGKPVKIQKSFEDHHKPCVSCHEGNNCKKCHGENEMAPFNHGKSTGWALTSYHSKLACERCHGNNAPVKKLSRNCTSCHRNFTPGNFNHKLTGLVLSDNHKDLECNNCHLNNDFAKDPKCTMCHDDKSFPAQLPGTKKGK